MAVFKHRDINDIDIIQRAVLNRKHQLAGQEGQHIDGEADGVQHLTVVQRMEKRLLRILQRYRAVVRQEPFARQPEAVHQQAKGGRNLAGMAGLVQHMGQI